MNAKKILVPTDFSVAGETALDYATSLARDTGATLFIVHVEEPPVAYGAGEFYALPPVPDADELRAMLTGVVPSDRSVRYEHRLLLGDPAGEIVQLAADEKMDLIVMGTHGRTGLRRLLMGSVAEAVVRRAACPVLTIKQPEGAAVEP
jgi:nucleotide-binding universal stress UspA family protein